MGTTYQALVRIAALVTGQSAGLIASAAVSEAEGRRLVVASEELLERARSVVQRVFERLTTDECSAADTADETGRVRTRLEAIRPSNRETWAWMLRAEAEALRLRTVAGGGGTAERPDPAELVRAWESSVAAFSELGHPYEVARSRARLAVALRAAERLEEARAVADLARETVTRLRARPLLVELDALDAEAAAEDDSHLTPREREVLALVARGLSNGQIGKQLYISTKTVSVHVSNLLAKLDAASRTEAAAIARERGLV